MTCHGVAVYNSTYMTKASSKAVTKHAGGRPLVITDEVVRELVELLRVGATVEQACDYAGIGRTSFYDRLKMDEQFAKKISYAQTFLSVSAKRNIADEVVNSHDVETSKWLLEKTEYRQKEAVAFEDKDVKFVVTRG